MPWVPCLLLCTVHRPDPSQRNLSGRADLEIIRIPRRRFREHGHVPRVVPSARRCCVGSLEKGFHVAVWIGPSHAHHWALARACWGTRWAGAAAAGGPGWFIKARPLCQGQAAARRSCRPAAAVSPSEAQLACSNSSAQLACKPAPGGGQDLSVHTRTHGVPRLRGGLPILWKDGRAAATAAALGLANVKVRRVRVPVLNVRAIAKGRRGQPRSRDGHTRRTLLLQPAAHAARSARRPLQRRLTARGRSERAASMQLGFARQIPLRVPKFESVVPLFEFSGALIRTRGHDKYRFGYAESTRCLNSRSSQSAQQRRLCATQRIEGGWGSAGREGYHHRPMAPDFR
jgi:hypothetical protein